MDKHYLTSMKTQSPFKPHKNSASHAAINAMLNRKSASSINMQQMMGHYNTNTLSGSSREQLTSSDFRQL